MVLSGEMVAAIPLNATSCSSGQNTYEASARFEWAPRARAASRPVAT